MFTEYAWHSLFIRNLLIRPERGELKSFVPELTIIDLPSFRADPARHGCRSETVIACDFTRKIVLIGGTSYAGEMKKSVFTYLNFVLPRQNVMPMHCSANVGHGGDVAVFFGLSGTGKTTLSADPAASCSATTSMAGAPTASSISRAAATPRRSACRARPSLRSSPPRSVSGPFWKT